MSARSVVFCTVQYSTQDMKIEFFCLDLAWLSDIKESGSFEVPVGGEIVITVVGTQHRLFGFQNRNYEKQYFPYDMSMRGGLVTVQAVYSGVPVYGLYRTID